MTDEEITHGTGGEPAGLVRLLLEGDGNASAYGLIKPQHVDMKRVSDALAEASRVTGFFRSAGSIKPRRPS